MSLIYQINKGINKPIEFRGLHGQYIAYLVAGLGLLLIGFALLYISGVSFALILPLTFGLGIALFFVVTRLSKRFGVHGLGKFIAKRGLPKYIRFRSRRVFIELKTGAIRSERAWYDRN
ncbi:hypothetical protein DBR43_09735 [Pedobacter sp. KBW06]|uniref:DUF4133 domain-containing protein n=1 Tax=Pedobacter sp. KBW06 TaxID=2153359 RepID=UPI000F5AA6C3|nr:DUF4133 domain-containing protein [Pedobacter sp. KBW06]RQO75608.1 hypothetical protein DBR43_09735 [Pedobacter sp. KBW06]